MKTSRWIFVACATVCCAATLRAQVDPIPFYQRWNVMEINRVATKFNNTGMLCDGDQQQLSKREFPAFEYPLGSGLSWGAALYRM